MNQRQQGLLNRAASAVSMAWADQWSMIEEIDATLAAEYLLTVAVAVALSEDEPGRVLIERLIGRTFCTIPMKRHIQTPIPVCLRQGRIDVVVTSDDSHFLPHCLIELKRDTKNLALIEADADRIALLISCTKSSLPDLFGFCLFPVILKPKAGLTCPKTAAVERIEQAVARLRTNYPTLQFNVHCSFTDANVERPSIVREEYPDGTEEDIWDSDGFMMMPMAITVERLISACT